MVNTKCPKCGSSNVIGYMGEWECMDCGHKFILRAEQTFAPNRVTREERFSIYKRINVNVVWILAVIIALLTGLVSGYLINQNITQAQTITETTTILQGMTKFIEITQTTVWNITRTVKETITMTTTVILMPTITTEEFTIKIGEPLYLNAWEIQITSIEEATYIRCDDQYYTSREGMRLIIVNILIANNGEEVIDTGEIWQVILFTDGGRSYKDISIESLEHIPLSGITYEIEEQAIEFKPRGRGQHVMPGTYVEEQLLFQILDYENLITMHIRISAYPTKTIIVSLE